jgi:hypothetical protein
MLALPIIGPIKGLILRPEPYLRQKQNGERKIEDVSLETIFRQLLLEDANNDPSPLPLALLLQEPSVSSGKTLRVQDLISWT